MAWTTRFFDTFTGTQYTDLVSHTPDTGTGWTKGGGGTLRLATGGTTVGAAGAARYYINDSLADKQAVQVKMLNINTVLVIRHTNTAATETGYNGYRVVWAADNTLRLVRVDNGTPSSTLDIETSIVFSGTPVLRVEADGYLITTFVDGVQKLSYDASGDATKYASGGVALYATATIDGLADDFTAEDEDAGPAGISKAISESVVYGTL